MIEKRINLVLDQLNADRKMKYHIAVLLFLLLVSVKVNSQGGWYPLQSGETEHIISIQFIDAQTGYYISTSNSCFRTIDGGAQWDLVETFAADISDMRFLNAVTGYISACGGILVFPGIHTTPVHPHVLVQYSFLIPKPGG